MSGEDSSIRDGFEIDSTAQVNLVTALNIEAISPLNPQNRCAVLIDGLYFRISNM